MEKINSAYNGSWIAVTERVPEPEVFVLCWDGKETFVEWFGSKPDAGRGVTHWMPYPMPQGATSDMHDGSRALSHPAPVAAPSDELQRLRGLAATCYAGLGAECNLPEAWLDALSAAANGETPSEQIKKLKAELSAKP